jgi:hypothetical protein
MFKYGILLKLVQGGVDSSLHLTVPSMNRLNQTKLAAFSISLEILLVSILNICLIKPNKLMK